MRTTQLIKQLPYSHPFLFVDEIEQVTDQFIQGNYTFPKDSFFYAGHFINHPVTPGVILTECMAQIGLVCLGITILNTKSYDFTQKTSVAMVESQVNFYKPVYPQEKVTVKSDLQYFRFNKLKCKVKLYNPQMELACEGTLSGVLIKNNE